MTSPHALSHEQAGELLPWLANDTLPPAERDAVRAHARDCVICRRELALLEGLATAMADVRAHAHQPAPDMRRINARIDAHIEARTRRGAALADSLRGFARNPWRVAFAVQTLVLAALAIPAIGFLRSSEPEPLYTTLTMPEAQPWQGHFRVVFEPGLRPAELQAILTDLRLEVIAGPTERGVYTLSLLPEEGARDAVLAVLEADDRVLFAQPVAQRDMQPDTRPASPPAAPRSPR